MKLFRVAIISAVFMAIGALSRADPAPTVHYAPAESLEHIDVELIDTAKHEIDFAARAAFSKANEPVANPFDRGESRSRRCASLALRENVDGTTTVALERCGIPRSKGTSASKNAATDGRRPKRRPQNL